MESGDGFSRDLPRHLHQRNDRPPWEFVRVMMMKSLTWMKPRNDSLQFLVSSRVLLVVVVGDLRKWSSCRGGRGESRRPFALLWWML